MNFKYGLLKDYFDGIGYKRLKPVEVDPKTSNEHEFNGISKFKELLGNVKRRFETRIIYLSDAEEDVAEDFLFMTWYDARKKHLTRTEFRLYYENSPCIDLADPEDLLVVCVNRKKNPRDENSLTVFIAKRGDTIERQLAWLFGIQLEDASLTGKIQHNGDRPVNFYMELILDKLGIPLTEIDDSLLSMLLERFNGRFPSTRAFSEFAREIVPDVNCNDDIDNAITSWMESEERAFRTLENHVVKQRVDQGFESVEDFIGFSLSVHNRRKSRAGHALENHLRHLFNILGIRHDFNEITENKSRPDFIFPGICEYRSSTFPAVSLTMLGVKTTCKDRWRQVLSEAQRISNKHLLTLEPGISSAQTQEMRDSHVQLVVPKPIVGSYTQGQQTWLMTIADFTQYVQDRESMPF